LPTALPVRYQREEKPQEFLTVVAFALSPLLVLAIAMLMTMPKSPCMPHSSDGADGLPREIIFARTGQSWSCLSFSAPGAVRQQAGTPVDDLLADSLHD